MLSSLSLSLCLFLLLPIVVVVVDLAVEVMGVVTAIVVDLLLWRSTCNFELFSLLQMPKQKE